MGDTKQPTLLVGDPKGSRIKFEDALRKLLGVPGPKRRVYVPEEKEDPCSSPAK